LIAEIVSPTDKAEDIFAKANEYLSSGCAEIWLIFPESQWVIITSDERFLFTIGEQAATQIILRGFKISIDELLA
jgi:Uma2 family endonuclease